MLSRRTSVIQIHTCQSFEITKRNIAVRFVCFTHCIIDPFAFDVIQRQIIKLNNCSFFILCRINGYSYIVLTYIPYAAPEYRIGLSVWIMVKIIFINNLTADKAVVIICCANYLFIAEVQGAWGIIVIIRTFLMHYYFLWEGTVCDSQGICFGIVHSQMLKSFQSMLIADTYLII